MQRSWLVTALVAAASLGACNGCRPSRTAEPEKPTLRLYLVSNVAGALEPCGCVRDQLGGLDHAAAMMLQGRKDVADAVMVEAGPLYFLDPVIKEERRGQELVKAQSIADILKGQAYVGQAPGRNDWALGEATLADLAGRSGGPELACNARPTGLLHTSLLRVIHGVKVGFIGVSQPDKSDIGAPLSASFLSPADAVKAEVATLVAQGAQVLVAVAAVGRGEAKRIADVAPELTALVVGAPVQSGEDNTDAAPPELVGDVLVAETSNHLQTLGVLDLFVRGDSYRFRDGTGLAQGQKRKDLERRIDELHGKLADWEKDPRIGPGDLAARRNDLAALEREHKALDEAPPPTEGSFFRYRVLEVRESAGTDPGVKEQFLAYYKKVNDMNRGAFADRAPPPVGPDGAGFAGIDACSGCHPKPRAVWDQTAHAHAYETLSHAFKEFNLDCVSCHVTGYEQPGGSSVTHVDKLRDVQCEVCHGPSSRHAANPTVKPAIARPGPDMCKGCHHPPHVHSFDAVAKLPEILGPGHGR